ncbi:hypothetical protein Neosp_011054 [[Neocosmospora] mangrovei]
MPPRGGSSRPVRRHTAFGNAFRALRRTRVRAIVAEIVASVTQREADRETEGSQQTPLYNDETILDEYLRGHERGLRLGLRRGHESGYRQGLAEGFAHGFRQGQETGYAAGFNEGAAYGSD